MDTDDRWDSVRKDWLTQQREDLAEQYGEDAVESVLEMTRLFANLIAVGSDNVPLIKAGVNRMAELVNGMLPRLRSVGSTRTLRTCDLEGALGDIPESFQELFIVVVGDALFNSKGGPFDSAVNINEAVDRLALIVREAS